MGAITYLLQVSGCMAIFYLFYYLLLRRLTFFTINRHYLLATLVLSFVIPLLTIPVHQAYSAAQVIRPALYIKTLQKYALVAHASPVSIVPAFSWLQVLKLVYAVVATALFFQLMVTLVNFFIKLKRRQVNRIGRIHILQGNKKFRNGSFLNYIFLNDDALSPAQVQQVIAHEMLHIKLQHSVDRIIMKIFQVILWFNPFVYLYARSMAENHEFEVDREIARSTDKKEYAGLLLHLSEAARGMLYNSFSKAPLKKRVTMLFNQPSAKTKKLVYVLVVPVLLLSCMAFATFKKDKGGNTIVSKLNKPTDAAAADGFRFKMLVLRVRREIKQVVGRGTFDDGKFYTRVTLKDGVYDMIGIRLNGALHLAILPHNASVAFIIKGAIHEEAEISQLLQNHRLVHTETNRLRWWPGVPTCQNMGLLLKWGPILTLRQ